MPLTVLKNVSQPNAKPVFRVDSTRLKVKYQPKKALMPAPKAGDRVVLKKQKQAVTAKRVTDSKIPKPMQGSLKRGLKTLQQDNPDILSLLANTSTTRYPSLFREIDEQLGFNALSWMLDSNKIRIASRRIKRDKVSRREKHIEKRCKDALDRAKFSSEKGEYFSSQAKQKELKASARQISEKRENLQLEIKDFSRRFGQMSLECKEDLLIEGRSLKLIDECLEARQKQNYLQQRLNLKKMAKLGDKFFARDASLDELTRQYQFRNKQRHALDDLGKALTEVESKLISHVKAGIELVNSYQQRQSQIDDIWANGNHYYLPGQYLLLEFTNRHIAKNYNIYRKVQENLRKQRVLIDIATTKINEKYQALTQGFIRLGPQKKMDA